MWNFISPRIVFGEDSLNALEEISGRRALIVTDHKLVELGLVDQVTDRLKKLAFQVQTFADVVPDPTTTSVIEGARAALDFQPDWIVGVGGGSPLDVAKAIWVTYERPDLRPDDINPFIHLGLRKKARLVTIPTTSGTGSEVTWAIVLTDPGSNRKIGLGNRENVADLALVDPALAAGMPPRLTADTGLDALTHAVEGFICTWHNDISEGLCLNAAREILEHLPVAFEASQSDQPDQAHYRLAREKMHHAASSAGLGFGNALSSLAHALGHTLGAVYHLPHGQAVGLCLPYTIEFASRTNSPRVEKLAQILGFQGKGGSSGQVFADALRELMASIASPGSLAELGIAEDDFESRMETLVDFAFNDAQILTAPRAPSYQELEILFRHVYRGQPVDF